MKKVSLLAMISALLFSAFATNTVFANGQSSKDLSCRIDFLGVVDAMSINHLLAQMHEDTCYSMTLFLTSPGGDVGPGMFILPDLLATDLHTYVRVEAGSMAAALFMAGDQRTVSLNAELYLHQLSGGVEGNPKVIREYAERLLRLQHQYAEFIASRTGGKLSTQQVLDLMTQDTFISASETLKYGLATGIAEH